MMAASQRRFAFGEVVVIAEVPYCTDRLKATVTFQAFRVTLLKSWAS
jgi:hypothetical protein